MRTNGRFVYNYNAYRCRDQRISPRGFARINAEHVDYEIIMNLPFAFFRGVDRPNERKETTERKKKDHGRNHASTKKWRTKRYDRSRARRENIDIPAVGTHK